MSQPLVEALRLRALPRPPVWIMRQAGRYLPEYRSIREQHTFQEVVTNPELAAEITMQPVRRFGMDGAVIFADIMTPVEAMGVEVAFDPGPKLSPLSAAQIADLPDLSADRVDFVPATIERVRSEVSSGTAVIGFAGGPVTLLAYLLDGGGSRDFMAMRASLRADPGAVTAALDKLASAMNTYLALQVQAGADVVQLFDTWAGLLDRVLFQYFAVPAARASLSGLAAPTIYFAPGAGHVLEEHMEVGADGYGVDWRVPIEEALAVFDGRAVQGNLDPAILLTDPNTITTAVKDLLARVGQRPGHIMNLGHGIDRRTPVENVTAFVEATQA